MSIIETEISEQPQVIRRLLAEEQDHVRSIVQSLQGSFKYVVIAARGTSDNAARYAQYLFGAHNQYQVALATPSLFTLYGLPPKLDEALVIGVSQSGQSPDIVAVLAEAHRQGRPTLSITKEKESPLAIASDYVIDLHTGPEQATAATKTYTASLAALALFSAMLEGDSSRLQNLKQLPDWMEATFEGLQSSLKRVERYRYMEQCTVIGRGYNYSTAFEVALKVKEMTRTIAEPYSSADFRHGPIAMVQNGFPVMVIAPSGSVTKDVTELVHDVRRREGELLVISDRPDLLNQAHLPLPLPSDVPEWLTPMIAVLPGQMFSLRLAESRGFNPDHPLGITKVTETY